MAPTSLGTFWGRLSNPLDIAETFAAQGPQPIVDSSEGVETAEIRPSDGHAEGPQEEAGQAACTSNEVCTVHRRKEQPIEHYRVL